MVTGSRRVEPNSGEMLAATSEVAHRDFDRETPCQVGLERETEVEIASQEVAVALKSEVAEDNEASDAMVEVLEVA